jgi:nucleotidyltransferase/DNA polymerase involved in DNA repair
LRALESVAPEVEPAGEGCGFVGISGLERLWSSVVSHQSSVLSPTGDRRPTTDDSTDLIGRALIDAVREATGLTASVAIASGKFVARVGALLSAPGAVTVIADGDERRFLREASVGLLPFEPEVAERLRSLSLHTLGEVAALPRPAVEAQFRSIGGRMWDLARGIDDEPLVPQRTPEAISERLTFESPVVTSEALVMAARQVVRRLAVRLDHRAARKMHAQVLAEGRLVWDRIETFRDATADEARMMTLLKTRLESLQLTEAVDTVSITLSEIVREPGKQGKLITETNPQLERLLEAVQESRARFGGPMVWRAVEVDPCSRHPEDRAMLIPYDA